MKLHDPRVAEAAERGGEHQNLRRMTLVLDVMASAPHGLRLGELASLTQLGKTTLSRLMSGLVEFGWVEQTGEDACYVLGMRFLPMALAAADRYGLTRMAEPWLRNIAAMTEDTVYLSMRAGPEAVCVARYEGDFPVKTLTLSVGDRRPLGVGAGSLALLAFLEDDDLQMVLERGAAARQRYQIDDANLRRLVVDARELGYALNNGMLISGMSGVAVPIRTSAGRTIAAVSVAAMSSRLGGDRLQEVVALLQSAATEIQTRHAAAVDFAAL